MALNRHFGSVGSERVEDHDVNGDGDDSELIALLPPRRGGISKKLAKPRRKVKWNDENGRKLTEVIVFERSYFSDSEDEESDSCLCAVM